MPFQYVTHWTRDKQDQEVLQLSSAFLLRITTQSMTKQPSASQFHSATLKNSNIHKCMEFNLLFDQWVICHEDYCDKIEI